MTSLVGSHRPQTTKWVLWAEKRFVYMTTEHLPVAPSLLVAMALQWLDDVVAA
jgi:hypothetical protein